MIHQISRLIREFESVLKNHGTHHEWILTDIPQNDVIFTTGLDRIVQRNTTVNLYMERDPIKIIAKDGSLSLLVERDNSLMKYLSEFMNFIPNVYANPAAIQLLQSKKLLT
ncbi:MAG: hypothetical protein UW69_C0095G0001 [Microgenomates group bacterium GW2011_GWA2_44_7]|nr:MAG: hypothetical protein UW69_C0095G0001 [Microgenomates group bacterium GW2011_GWA2_44_7]